MGAVRVGVIGCGYWGPNLIRNFDELGASEIVAVADLNQQRLAHIKTRFPTTQVTTDYRDLFSLGLDAVVVATPPATHYAIAREALNNGLGVLVEKPLALNSAHAEELVELAARRKLTLMVGHTFEYNPAVHELKRLISSGEVGEVYYIDAVRVNLGLFQPKANVLWDLAPHDISIILYLLGHRNATISAQGTACIFDGIHDVVYMNMQFPGGPMAHIRVSWLDPSKTRRITVVGSKKMVVYDDVEPLEKIKIYDKGVDRPPYTDTFGEFQCCYRYGDVVIPHISFAEPLRQECQHFVECVASGRTPQSDGLIGLNVVKVLEAAQRSLQSGGSQQQAELELPELRHGELGATHARAA
jgi:predicted dehydrogenase